MAVLLLNEIGQAIDRAFSQLGDFPKRALVYHLLNDYNIDIYGDNVSLEKIESGLQRLMGAATPAIMALIEDELRK